MADMNTTTHHTTSTAASTTDPIRVLCLHDANSNASELYDILQPLDERLYNRHSIEFVYIDSPLCCSQEDHPRPQQQQQVVDHVQKRIWWEESHGEDINHPLPQQVLKEEQPNLQEQDTRHYNNDNNDDMDDDDEHNNNNAAPSSSLTPTPPPQCPSRNVRLGLDASLVHIRQVWNTMPFQGILAVGQGCAVASLLPFLMNNGDSSSSSSSGIHFAIFIQGQALLEEDESFMEDDESQLKCLHITNGNNPLSQRLVTQLGGQVHVSLDKNSMTKQDFNVIGKFLVQEKKRLRGSEGGCQKLALQSELHRVEQEASRVVAEQIRENPPKALMAIITPQSIGGWSGPKRRGPQDEGGGAPCPSEFLLNKEIRKTTPGGVVEDGPSRQHPDSAGNPK